MSTRCSGIYIWHFGGETNRSAPSALETRLLTYMVEFHCMMCLHLRTTVASPVTVGTRCYSSWQFSWKDVLSVFVGQLLECSQAAAEAQDDIGRDTRIWQRVVSLLQGLQRLLEQISPRLPSGGQVVLKDLWFIVIVVQHTIQAFVCQIELAESSQTALTANPLATPVHMTEWSLAQHTLLSSDLLAV